MLETLLESKSHGRRSPGGAIASVTAHTALIAAALYATAQARVEPSRSPETVRPIYFPSPVIPAPQSPNTIRPTHSNEHRLIFVEPNLDIKVPAIDITGNLSKQDDFGPRVIGPTGSSGRGETGAISGDTPFRADQVEKQVAVVPGSRPPRYPELLRSAGVEGQVTAVFVVDELGRAEEGSIRFVRSDNRLFEAAVMEALRRMRFIPAEAGGRKVRQLVQMPFVFTLAR
jgi:periplasmic protein TonB